MKISFYTRGTEFNGNTIAEKGLGGSESAMLYMARELARRGHTVSVFCSCDTPGNYDNVGYRHEQEFLGYCQAARQDVCIFSRLYEPLVEANCRVKILWLHDIAGNQYYTSGLPVIDSHIDRYFVISDWQRQGYLEKFGFDENRFYLTRNGVDLSLFDSKPTRNRNKLIYINTPFRGLDVLIQLFPKIRHAVPEAELHLYTGMSLYGNQFMEWEDQLKALYRQAQSMPGVYLREPVPKAELAAELQTSGLSVYPSHFEECCSIASLEVQAAGVPMVTSDLAGLRDTIQNRQTGILIPIDDVQARSHSQLYQERFLAETTRLLKDTLAWNALSSNAINSIRENYTWTLIAGEWEEELNDLLSA